MWALRVEEDIMEIIILKYLYGKFSLYNVGCLEDRKMRSRQEFHVSRVLRNANRKTAVDVYFDPNTHRE